MSKRVYISISNNIYKNLALEDWLYQNLNFNKDSLLLIWRNQPCVVIGTFQNPWLETNPSALPNIGKGVLLARRKSGGGTVYHDDGNLNLTFFTTAGNFNRRKNLEFVREVLLEKYSLSVDISRYFDLHFQGAKISGSASKIGRKTAYHHCTLLVGVNEILLKKSLQSSGLNIETKSTKSKRSKVINLKEINPDLNVVNLIKNIQIKYLHVSRVNKVEFLDPRECQLPGFDSLIEQLTSWEWLYGRTPKFSVVQNFEAVEKEIKIDVEKGRISHISGGFFDIKSFEEYVGRKFDQEMFDDLHRNMKSRLCANFRDSGT